MEENNGFGFQVPVLCFSKQGKKKKKKKKKEQQQQKQKIKNF